MEIDNSIRATKQEKKSKKPKTPEQIFSDKLANIRKYRSRVFTSERLNRISALSIDISFQNTAVEITDCNGKVRLLDDFDNKEEFIIMRNRLFLLKNEFARACEFIDGEIQRLDIEI